MVNLGQKIEEIRLKISEVGMTRALHALLNRVKKPISEEMASLYHNVRSFDPEEICARQIRVEPGYGYLEYFRKRGAIMPFTQTLGAKAALVRERVGYKKTIEKADLILEGRVSIFGDTVIELDAHIDWHKSYPEPGKWPQIYFRKLHRSFRNDFQNSDYKGDILFPWELGKQLYLLDLARAYNLTLDEKYAEAFVYHISSWIDSNPYNIGIHWMNALIVAQRAIAWGYSLMMFLNSPTLKEDFIKKLMGSLFLHGQHIHRNLEVGRLRNNHLIGNIAGLYFLGTLFPEFSESDAWLSVAKLLLREECERQIYADGVDFEQSSIYHRYVLELLLVVFIASKATGDSEDICLLKQRLEKMTEYLLWIVMPDGTVPIIGDNHETNVFRLSNDCPNNVRGLFGLGAYLFGRCDFKHAAMDQVEELIWLYGREGVNYFDSLQGAAPGQTFKAFDEGGYYVHRDHQGDDSTVTIIDCGNIGMGQPRKYIGSHGHCDICNIILAIQGTEIVVDSGCFTYTGSKYWHDYFRCTSGHNTVVVDDKDQCGLLATWQVLRQPRITKRAYGVAEEGTFYVEGAHDAYYSAEDPMIHSRRIGIDPIGRRWNIFDEFNSEKSHKYDCLLHFHPAVKVMKSSEDSLAMGVNGLNVIISASCRFSESANTIPVVLSIEECWYSPHYGKRQESSMARISWFADRPCVCETTIKHITD